MIAIMLCFKFFGSISIYINYKKRTKDKVFKRSFITLQLNAKHPSEFK